MQLITPMPQNSFLEEKLVKITDFDEEKGIQERKVNPAWHIDCPEWEDGYVCGIRDIKKIAVALKAELLKGASSK